MIGKNKFFNVLKAVLAVSLLIIISTSLTNKKKSCRKGNSFYHQATYSELKDSTKKKLESILSNDIIEFFCEEKILNLPRKGKKRKGRPKRKYSIGIEPLFVDLNNKNGLYSYRSWLINGAHARFRSGYPHYYFIISDNQYFSLASNDSLKNVQLIKSKLTNHFTPSEVEYMIEWTRGFGSYSDYLTYYPPMLLKRDSKILWDIRD